MERRAIRDIRSVLVGTGSTILLPERNARLLTVVGAPPPPAIPALPSISTVLNAAIDTTGSKLGFVVPAGGTARVVGWSWASVSTTAVLQLRLTHGGSVFTVDQGAANVWRIVNIPVLNPDAVNIVVATAGAAAETANLLLAVETYTAGPRISLGFGSPAVLDSGITIYAGQLPLILPGPALDTDIFAVADAAGRLVNVIDLFYP